MQDRRQCAHHSSNGSELQGKDRGLNPIDTCINRSKFYCNSYLQLLICCFILFLAGLFAGLVDSIAKDGALVALPPLLFFSLAPHLAPGTLKRQGRFGTLVAAQLIGARIGSKPAIINGTGLVSSLFLTVILLKIRRLTYTNFSH